MRKVLLVFVIGLFAVVNATSLTQEYSYSDKTEATAARTAEPVVVVRPNEAPVKQRVFRPYVDTLFTGADGYDNGLLSRSGTEIWIKHLMLNLSGSVNTSDKSYMKTGTSFGVDGAAYLNFKKYLLLGGGYSWGKLLTPDWTKQSTHPYLSGGVNFLSEDSPLDGFRFTTSYVFPGSDARNGVTGWKLESLLPLRHGRTKVFGIIGFDTYSIFETDCPSCQRMRLQGVRLGIRVQR